MSHRVDHHQVTCHLAVLHWATLPRSSSTERRLRRAGQHPGLCLRLHMVSRVGTTSQLHLSATEVVCHSDLGLLWLGSRLPCAGL